MATSWTWNGSNLRQCSSILWAQHRWWLLPHWVGPCPNLGRTTWGQRIHVAMENAPWKLQINQNDSKMSCLTYKLHCHSILLLRQGLKKGSACKKRAGHQCGILKSSVAFLQTCGLFSERSHGSRDPSLLFTVLSLLLTSMVSSRSNTAGFKCPCANNRRTRSCDVKLLTCLQQSWKT